jgi:hypothetical protein
MQGIWACPPDKVKVVFWPWSLIRTRERCSVCRLDVEKEGAWRSNDGGSNDCSLKQARSAHKCARSEQRHGVGFGPMGWALGFVRIPGCSTFGVSPSAALSEWDLLKSSHTFLRATSSEYSQSLHRMLGRGLVGMGWGRKTGCRVRNPNQAGIRWMSTEVI